MQLPKFDRARLVRIVGASAIAFVAAGWMAWAQVGSTGVIYGCVNPAGQIRGIDEATGSCRTGDQKLSWYTKQGADAMFLGRQATASNADTLDGLDSSAFALSGHRHDGLYLPLDAAGNFLPANGKASDADLLDGIDSTGFVRATDLAALAARVAALEAVGGGGSDDGGPPCESNPSCSMEPVDVVFLMDATGDMGGEINNLKNALQLIITTLTTSRPNTRFAVAEFRDFPIAPYGSPSLLDQPFNIRQRLSDNVELIRAAVNTIDARGGGDDLESGHEALYQVATSDLGFRDGSKRIVVVITSAGFHNDYNFSFHDQAAAIQALVAQNARVIGVVGPANDSTLVPRDTMRSYAVATGAVVTPAAFGLANQCGTGIAGSPVATGADGLCPLVFDVDSAGSGLGSAIVAAVTRVP